MKPKLAESVSLAAVAKAAGVAKSTASLALRGSVHASADAVMRVKAAAEKLGYRPDSRVGALMARHRRARPLLERETLAFVWVSVTRRQARTSPSLRAIREGASRRAEQLGCRLDDFWLNEDGMTAGRLETILRTRGITGVVFSTPMHDMEVGIDWDWSGFAAVVIGNSEWHPALHRVGHHHYRSMWVAMEKLRAAGSRRPAALLHEPHHRRLHGVHQAAFLANHPQPGLARRMARFDSPGKVGELRPWFDAIRADALILVVRPDDAALDALRAVSGVERIVTLTRPGRGLPGMDMREDLIAENAVDAVVSQLHRNERGVPSHPTALLLEGEWRE